MTTWMGAAHSKKVASGVNATQVYAGKHMTPIEVQIAELLINLDCVVVQYCD